MSWTTWQCRDNSTFIASACFDSIIFKGKGRVSRLGHRWKIDCWKKTPKTKQTKKTKTKGRKIKKRETNKNTQLLVFNLLFMTCNVMHLKFMWMHWMFTQYTSFICINLKFKYTNISYCICIQRVVIMNNRNLITRFVCW